MSDPSVEPTPTAAGAAIPKAEPGQIVLPEGFQLVETTLDECVELPGCGLSYSFHRANTGTLRLLGRLKSDKRLQRKPGLYVATYLAACLAELGGESMGPVAANTKGTQRIMELVHGDVLFLLMAWTHSRHKRRGVPLGVGGCGVCGSEWGQVRVVIGDLKVMAYPRGPEGQVLPPPRARVGLWEGFPLTVGSTAMGEVTTVVVEAPKWGPTFGSMAKEAWDNVEAIRAVTAQGSIRAMDANPKLGMIPQATMDLVMEDDLDLVDEAVGQITPSPFMAVEIDCPTCKAPNTAVLDWRNLGFFGGRARG